MKSETVLAAVASWVVLTALLKKQKSSSSNIFSGSKRDELTREHPELSDKVTNKLKKAIERYSESENWYPGWEFLEHVRDSRS